MLFRLDSRETQARVAADEARFQAAAAKADSLSPAIPAADQKSAVADRDLANAALAAAKAALATANIRAPIDGTLTAFEVFPGAFVEQGVALTQIVNTTDLSVNFGVTPIADVKLGQKITFEFAGKDFPGEVTYVAPNVDVPANTYQVSAHLTGGITGLKPGTFGYVVVSK